MRQQLFNKRIPYWATYFGQYIRAKNEEHRVWSLYLYP